jgi:hypothetical protein
MARTRFFKPVLYTVIALLPMVAIASFAIAVQPVPEPDVRTELPLPRI